MTIDTNTLVSITEANQNFSKVARLVDEKGSAIILKNNVPRYLVIDFSKAEEITEANDTDVMAISHICPHQIPLGNHSKSVPFQNPTIPQPTTFPCRSRLY